MATQMQLAREGKITEAMRQAAQREHIEAETLRERIAKGTVALCANINHAALKPCAVGEGLSTKVNANIGTSSTYPDIEPELKKLDEAVKCGADAVMARLLAVVSLLQTTDDARGLGAPCGRPRSAGGARSM